MPAKTRSRCSAQILTGLTRLNPLEEGPERGLELAISFPVFSAEEGANSSCSLCRQFRAHQELSQGSRTLHVRDGRFEKHGFRAIKAQLLSIPSLISIDFQCR